MFKKAVYTSIGALLLVWGLAIPTNASSTNLIANDSVELATNDQPDAWSNNSWGANAATFSYADTGYDGGHSLHVQISNYSDGDAKWMPSAAAVSAGQTYTYTDYYQANIASDLDASFSDLYGNQIFVYLTTVPASSDWQQATSTFTVPDGFTNVSIYHLIAQNGWLTTDDFSLDVPTPEEPAPPDDNLLANPSLETADGNNPAHWNQGGWGTNSANFSYASGDAHSGDHSVSLTMASYSDGDAKWYADPVGTVGSNDYTYSDYYQSNTTTQLVAAFTDAAGNQTYVNLPDAPVSTAWRQYSTTFTAPAGSISGTVYHLLNQVGTLTLDDVSLTTVQTTNTEALVNPSLETNNGSSPAGWEQGNWGNNTATFTYASGDAHSGDRSAKVTLSNYVDGDAKWYFDPLTTLTPDSQYRFSAWYKTNTQPKVVAMYTTDDGAEKYFNLPMPAPGTDSGANWQQYTSTFDMPADATSLTVFILISSNGWLQTDDYSITPHSPTGFSEPMISLTFDDGWASIYTNGLPLLQQYNLVSTQYLISGKLNTAGYMTTAMAQAFLAAGSEVGSHTVTHPDLAQLSANQLSTELSTSQSALQTLFGNTVAQNLASPYGSYNQAVVTDIKQYYRSHRSTDAGFNSKDSFEPYNIRVQNVDTDTTPAEVAAWVAHAKATNSWLVLVFHQVSSAPNTDDYTVTPANLATELADITASGIPVKTISQALDEIADQ